MPRLQIHITLNAIPRKTTIGPKTKIVFLVVTCPKIWLENWVNLYVLNRLKNAIIKLLLLLNTGDFFTDLYPIINIRNERAIFKAKIVKYGIVPLRLP